MMSDRLRLLMINAFRLSPGNYSLRPASGTREQLIMDYENVAHLLTDVEWDVNAGALTTHGDWAVEALEEFLAVGANRLPLVREACESGKYDAIVLFGGGDPGFQESREIARGYGIPVTSCAHAQMHVAGMVGNRFGIIDISEKHNAQMAKLVVEYRFTERCTGIRNIDFPLPRPQNANRPSIASERARALAGEHSAMLEAAFEAAEAAIQEDGAEVLMLGCSAAYWMQPFLRKRLDEAGWDIPVLEGYRCAIEQAKLLARLGLDASGMMIPRDPPARSRKRKLI
jgi:allantoin racemase